MDDIRRSRRPWRPRIREISAEQARSFGILRRPWCDDDLLPDGETFASGGVGRCGLNPALARRATTQIGDLWVVPGNGHIAIFDGGATCTATKIVRQKGLMMWGSSREMRPSVAAHGLVPDGVEAVTLFAASEPLHLLAPAVKDHGSSPVVITRFPHP